MAMTINTNIQSLNAQRNLGTSQSSLSTSMQRLSSGMRINSAKDDAAGLAIAERMSAQVRGLNQAQRNANDGVSLAQTAEGALSTIGGNLQRIRELAVQSRNATNSEDDRASLQKEVTQLKSEIDRVAKNTSFNGTNLLDGSFSAKEFQVGANQGQTIKVDSIVNASMDSLGSWKAVDTPTESGKISLDATEGATASVAAGASAAVKLTIAGVDIDVTLENKGSSAKVFSADEVARALDTKIAEKSADLTAAGVSITGSLAKGTLKVSNTLGTAQDVTLTGVKDATKALSEDAGAGATKVTVAAATPGTSQTGFADLDVSTTAGADNAILAMDAALKSVNSARADLGAIQNRFESVVSNLSVNSENLSASKSRIMDADFASETANLSRSQILQQAGTAMVAQANQLPQGVLSLLR